MVRLKIAYWEFDFEAVCPTLDHDLLSQAHIYILHVCFQVKLKEVNAPEGEVQVFFMTQQGH